jgi:hypothetical protein
MLFLGLARPLRICVQSVKICPEVSGFVVNLLSFLPRIESVVNPLLYNKPSGCVYKNHSAGEDLCKCGFATLQLRVKQNGITIRKILVMKIFLFSRNGSKAVRIDSHPGSWRIRMLIRK